MAIASAAAQAAGEAKDAATAATQIAEAAQAKADSLNLTVPPEVIQQLAETTAAMQIAELRRVGALRDDPPTPPAAAASLPAAPASVPATPPAGESGRRKTLAERICDVVIPPGA
jgi:hypothetical protein